MRPVKGLDRPRLQWALVSVCVLLVILLAATAGTLVRMHGWLREERAETASAERRADALEGQLARERAAREAFALELERQRKSARGGAETVLLRPSRSRQPQPPPAAFQAAAASQVVLLRLALPGGSSARFDEYQIVVRDWSDGRSRWSRGGLIATSSSDGRVVGAYVTGEMLPAGAYEIVLSGAAGTGQHEVARYEMTVR